jgi:hypothetical protein
MQIPDNDARSLAARMDKLESQNRKWKLASLVLGLATASLIAIAAKPADHYDSNVLKVRTVEAQDFVLKDEDGQVYARLTLNPRPKATKNSLLLNPEGPALQFYDAKGNPTWTAPGLPSMLPAR